MLTQQKKDARQPAGNGNGPCGKVTEEGRLHAAAANLRPPAPLSAFRAYRPEGRACASERENAEQDKNSFLWMNTTPYVYCNIKALLMFSLVVDIKYLYV